MRIIKFCNYFENASVPTRKVAKHRHDKSVFVTLSLNVSIQVSLNVAGVLSDEQL